MLWRDLSEQTKTDLHKWYNSSKISTAEKNMLAALYSSGRFYAWDCPNCGARVYRGDPRDWGNYQGVLQVDYTSYPGNDEKYTAEYLEKLCDNCRMAC